jgi:hypothetical protein
MTGASAWEKPPLTGLEALLNGLQSSLAHSAALKAANRGHKVIRLREQCTKKSHISTGERVQVDKPKDAPAWMGDKIWKPKVKKVGTEKLE